MMLELNLYKDLFVYSVTSKQTLNEMIAESKLTRMLRKKSTASSTTQPETSLSKGKKTEELTPCCVSAGCD